MKHLCGLNADLHMFPVANFMYIFSFVRLFPPNSVGAYVCTWAYPQRTIVVFFSHHKYSSDSLLIINLPCWCIIHMQNSKNPKHCCFLTSWHNKKKSMRTFTRQHFHTYKTLYIHAERKMLSLCSIKFLLLHLLYPFGSVRHGFICCSVSVLHLWRWAHTQVAMPRVYLATGYHGSVCYA